MLLIWALTGAFYPAVDLCAGEKERGTLETLLSSPAERTEIVWGKLLTIMLFSMVTPMLNLISMGITGSLVLGHCDAWGRRRLMRGVVAARRAAAGLGVVQRAVLVAGRVCAEHQGGTILSDAAGAVRDAVDDLPMAPGVELNLGNSLIPVTGVVLLLRTMLEGNYALAAPFVAPAGRGRHRGCCHFAIRWAAEQFNSEWCCSAKASGSTWGCG